MYNIPIKMMVVHDDKAGNICKTIIRNTCGSPPLASAPESEYNKSKTKAGEPMAYRIAICDDSGKDAEFVQGILNHWALQRQADIQAEVFSSAERFLFRYAGDKDWDILLLDIEMGAMDGVTLAKRVRRDNESVQIVFITGFADYMAEGYEVSALHYLMKPVREDKLFAVLDRAAAVLQKAERFVLLPVGGEMLRLPVTQVQYVEAFSHSVAIVTGTDTIQVKMPISEIEKLLGEGFVRCHRSYLAGLKYIARLSKTEVILDSGKALPLSRSAAPLVHQAFISYYTGDQDETV